MKKYIFSLIICLLLTTNIAFSNVNKGTVMVSTTIEDEVAPNLASFNVTVEVSDKNKKIAVAQNNDISQTLIAAVKAKLIHDENIKTTSYNVRPVYVYDKKTNKQVFDKYVVTNSLKITIEDLSKIGDFIELAIKNGATNVDGLRFSLKNNGEDYCMNLYKKAGETNIQKAKFIAKAMNEKIGKAKRIEMNCSPAGIYSNRYVYAAKSAAAGADSVERNPIAIEAGSIKVNATVYSEFYLK